MCLTTNGASAAADYGSSKCVSCVYVIIVCCQILVDVVFEVACQGCYH